VFRMLL